MSGKEISASKAAAIIRILGIPGKLDPRFVTSVTERIRR